MEYRLVRGLPLLIVLLAVSCSLKGGGSSGRGGDPLISADPTEGQAPLTVNFVAPILRDGSPIVSFLWDFGDPESDSDNTSVQRDTSHTYTSGGSYTVSLTTITSTGPSTATRTDLITVTEAETPPTAFFSADLTSGGAPLLVTFMDQSVEGNAPIDSWLWNFGDPASGSQNTRTEQNPSHLYEAPGMYTVTLTVTTQNGSDTETQVDFITVVGPDTPPTADFSSDTTTGDVPLSVAFTDDSFAGSSPITAWLWTFGDPASGAANTSTIENPSHTYNETGAYTVSLTVRTLDGLHTTTKEDYVSVSSPLPVAEFSADSTSGKPPFTVTFTDQSLPGVSPITSWFWNFGDPASGAANASSAQNPSHTYNDLGSYTVSLMVTTAEGSDTLAKIEFITAEVPVTKISSTSPAMGEDGVTVTRETVVRFENPLDPGSVTAGTITAEYGGQELSARLHLSPDATTASLYYDDDLPTTARIRVTIDGDLLLDDGGELVDGDEDGFPGGVSVIEFDTLSATPVQGTAVIGRVFASELVTTKSGTSVNAPLEGATITVDGSGGTVTALTDALGNFRLDPAPAGRFFVEIDGGTAVSPAVPVGAYYPAVRRAWEALAGAETVIGDVFLPLIAADTLQPVSESSDTIITFPAPVLAAHPVLSGVQIVVPADSLFSDDGTRGGLVGIAPVPPDRLPGQLPAGLNCPIVIIVETDGATNFDVPVAVRFPNHADPITNEILLPGATTALWSFNNDTGRFEVVGPATVSNDGQFIVSDPGFGILAPGLHTFNPGTSGSGGGARGTEPGNAPDDCKADAELLIGIAEQCAATLASIPLEVAPEVSCGLNATAEWQDALIQCSINPEGCSRSFIETTIGSLIGCMPGMGGSGSASIDCLSQLGDAEDGLLTCPAVSGLGTIGSTIYAQQRRLLLKAYDVYSEFFGSAVWTDFESDEAEAMLDFYIELQSVFDPVGDGGEVVTPAERTVLVAVPRAASISVADVDELIARWTTFLQGDLATLDIDLLSLSVEQLRLILIQLEGSDWTSTLDGFGRASNVTASLIGTVVGSSGGVSQAPLYFKATDLSTGSAQRGRVSALGTIDALALANDTKYIIHYLHPATRESGSVVILSASAGQATEIPATYLFIEAGVDADGDGLTDKHEDVVGSNPLNPDTDGDGIEDGVELQQATNPLDALDVAAGLIATVDTPGTAFDVHASDEMILVADGLEGIAVFNVYAGMNPTIIAQVDTPGFAQAVAYSNGVAAVADGDEGLAIIDVSDPADPFVVAQISIVDLSGSPHAVAMQGDTIIAATPSGMLTMLDSSGTILDAVDLVERIEDVSIKGNHLFAATSGGGGSAFHVLDLDASPLVVATSIALTLPAPPMGIDHRWRIFLGEDIAYLTTHTEYATVDITNPTGPFVIKEISPSGLFGFRHAVTTGSGIGIVAVGPDALDPGQPSDISLFDTSNPNVTTTLLTTIETPGVARAVNLLNGLAYVADQTAGLQVVNYLPYDTLGFSPVVSFVTDAGGSSLVEGSSLLVTVTAFDDVQVRNVELLVDGVSAHADGNFPYVFVFPVPLSSEANAVSLSVTATDTGGNRAETTALDFTIVAK